MFSNYVIVAAYLTRLFFANRQLSYAKSVWHVLYTSYDMNIRRRNKYKASVLSRFKKGCTSL